MAHKGKPISLNERVSRRNLPPESIAPHVDHSYKRRHSASQRWIYKWRRLRTISWQNGQNYPITKLPNYQIQMAPAPHQTLNKSHCNSGKNRRSHIPSCSAIRASRSRSWGNSWKGGELLPAWTPLASLMRSLDERR